MQNFSLLFTFLFCFVALISSYSFAYEREGGVQVGAYGSVRFELGKDKATFTLRRVVPTFSATLKERLRFYTELEFERFGLLELAEEFSSSGEYPILTKTEIEGSSGSEIKLEQMWGEFEISRAFRFRVGAILPPVGRFNLLHDDDLWEPARRPLSVRDATVLPEKIAWTELGAGFTGEFDIADFLAGYQLYIVNGVTLEHDVEIYLIRHRPADEPEHTMLKMESVIKPRFGSFKEDLKREKAITGRVFFSPSLGTEFGISGYFGRYTPSFLPSANVGTAAFDFKVELGKYFDVEGEYAFTQFSNIEKVISSLSKLIVQKEAEIFFEEGETSVVEVEGTNQKVELEITPQSGVLADRKHGGWILFRFKFFPSFLKNTPLYVDDSSRFVLFVRPEIVSFSNLVDEVEIEKGEAEIQRVKKSIFRNTVGIAYRPTDTWVFSISYELTKEANKETQNLLLFGFAFGL